jgi:ribose transport system substrate-binding protein
MKSLSVRVVAALACISSLTTSAFAQSKGTIGVSLLTRQHQFYRDLEKGMKEEADKNGFTLQIVSSEMDDQVQATQVDDFISKKVDAMVLCPSNSDTIKTSISKAKAAGIPVFTADIAAHGADVVSHIASDNVEGGRLAAKAIIKALPDGGNIAILNHPTVASVQDRTKGFREIIDKNSKFKIEEDLPANGKRDKAMQVMQDILQKGKKIDGVFGINDDTALGALSAIQQANKKGIIIVGYDATTEAKEKIDAGEMYADAIQFPDQIGKITVQSIAKHLKGEDVPAKNPVPTGLYMKGGKIIKAEEMK